MELILIRHTELANPDKLCYGRTDLPLTADFDTAADEIKNICNVLTDLSRAELVCSPSPRCQQLAAVLKADFSFDPRLYELNFGSWEGIPWDKIDEIQLFSWMDNFVGRPVPGGESYLDLQARVMEYVSTLNQADTVIIVSHGGPIRAIIASLLHISLYDSFQLNVPYGAVFRIQTAEGLCNTVNFLHPAGKPTLP